MQRRGKYVLLLPLFLFLWGACKKGHRCDCLKRTGQPAFSHRELAEFNEIYLEDKIDLVLVRDSVNRANVEAGENLLPGIETEVSNGRLTIRNTNRCNLSRDLHQRPVVYLYYKSISHLFYTGAGNIKTANTIRDSLFRFETQNGAGSISLDVDVKVLYVSLHTGPSDIHVTGSAHDSFVYNAGNGYVYMENTSTDYTFVNSLSTGDCYVWTTGILDAVVGYHGNIFYKGTPSTIRPTLKGEGQLKQL